MLVSLKNSLPFVKVLHEKQLGNTVHYNCFHIRVSLPSTDKYRNIY